MPATPRSRGALFRISHFAFSALPEHAVAGNLCAFEATDLLIHRRTFFRRRNRTCYSTSSIRDQPSRLVGNHLRADERPEYSRPRCFKKGATFREVSEDPLPHRRSHWRAQVGQDHPPLPPLVGEVVSSAPHTTSDKIPILFSMRNSPRRRPSPHQYRSQR